MIRSKGEAGTGDIVNAVTHLRKIRSELRWLSTLGPEELAAAAKDLQSPLPLVRQVAAEGKLPVVLFCAGGIATPADASLVMQLGAEGVFVGSGIFKSGNPAQRAEAVLAPPYHMRSPRPAACGWTRSENTSKPSVPLKSLAGSPRTKPSSRSTRS